MPCGSTNRISIHPINPPSFPDLGRVWRAPLAWLGGVFLAGWRRRQYAGLLELDDRLLADIGISRQQAVDEGLKSSWMNLPMTRYIDR